MAVRPRTIKAMIGKPHAERELCIANRKFRRPNLQHFYEASSGENSVALELFLNGFVHITLVARSANNAGGVEMCKIPM